MTAHDVSNERSVPDSWRTQLATFDRRVGQNPWCATPGCLHLAQEYVLGELVVHTVCPVCQDDRDRGAA